MSSTAPLRVGRYVLHGVVGTGGMATVHFGRLEGPGGFARVVAIKRLHPQFAGNEHLAARFLDEARLPTRIRHANVVQTIDVVVEGRECLVVMEYVPGETLSRLLQVACLRDEPPPPRIVSAIVGGALHGLHAAHHATSARGEPLSIVHRDVSPHNILVGADGVARILDFGIAKAREQTSLTPGGQLKGKTSYMAPEQLRGRAVTAQSDVFSAAIVLWETLVARRLFLDETEAQTLANLLRMPIEAPSAHVPSLPKALDAVVLRGLERDPTRRFASAREMARALERAVPPASSAEVAAWVEELAHDALLGRAELLHEVETCTAPDAPPEVSQVRAAPAAGSVDTPALVAAAPAVTRSSSWWARASVLGAAALMILVVVLARRELRGPAHASPIPAAPAWTDEASAPSAPDNPAGVYQPSPAPPAADGRVRSDHPVRVRAHGAKSTWLASQCTPPYRYDSDGHKVFKPQCF